MMNKLDYPMGEEMEIEFQFCGRRFKKLQCEIWYEIFYRDNCIAKGNYDEPATDFTNSFGHKYI